MWNNGDVPWHAFDPESYFVHNYEVLRRDERRIIEVIRDFFCSAPPAPGAHGIDVGTGPNLYPAMAMLGSCNRITLLDYSKRNVDWLRRELTDPDPAWHCFWDVFATASEYRRIGDPWAALRRQVTVLHGSLFDLPDRRWDAGTMFFVAESISAKETEFAHAIERFIHCLKPRAPFAAAFMENSQGYSVGTGTYPAVAVTAEDVHRHLQHSATDLLVERVGVSDPPLRDGYSGMVVACGFAGAG
jgi:hypothetical protein